jgi:hypothetical protein
VAARLSRNCSSVRTVSQFFAGEMAKPLGLDLWIGLPETEEHRVADQFSSLPEATPQQTRDQLQALGIDTANPVVATMLASYSLGGQDAMRLLNSRDGHAAEVPSANGIGNARSLARLYAALVGEVDGVRLLQPGTVEWVRAAQTDAMTAPGPLAAIPQPFPLRFVLGYEAPRAGSPLLGDSCFGHAGLGGRLAFADPATGTAAATAGPTASSGSRPHPGPIASRETAIAAMITNRSAASISLAPDG